MLLRIILPFLLFLCFLVSCDKDDDTNAGVAGNNTQPAINIDDCIQVQNNNDGLVSFSATCFENGDSLTWDFGDTTFSDSINPIHIYERPGSFVVILEIKRLVENKYKIHRGQYNLSIDEVCKTCTCKFPGGGSPNYLEFCGTGIKAEEYCRDKCYTNQWCSTCN